MSSNINFAASPQIFTVIRSSLLLLKPQLLAAIITLGGETSVGWRGSAAADVKEGETAAAAAESGVLAAPKREIEQRDGRTAAETTAEVTLH